MDTKIVEGFSRKKLATKFKKLGFNTGVEVGVRKGYFSKEMCRANRELNLKAVDPYDLVYGDSRSHEAGIEATLKFLKSATRRLKPYNCELIKKTSLDAVRDIPYESVDFVYIDGSHEFDYVMCDIIEWGKRVRKGGIISGHDYYNFRRSGVVEAVDLYTKKHKVKTLYLTDERTPSWWFTRKW